MSGTILVVDDSPTIRRVVSSILERSEYETLAAGDGVEALEQLSTGPKVDLVLLDFVMPRMNGYQFCRALRSDAKLKGLPVVLMSAKGDKIRGHFVQQTGAIDAITKPFDARGLVAVVEGALKRHKDGRARPLPDAGAMPENDDSPDSMRTSATMSRNPAVMRARATAEFGATLAGTLMPELSLVDRTRAKVEDQFKAAIARALTPDRMAELIPLIEGFDLGARGGPSLSGDISVISMAEALQMLQMQRQSGVLSVVRPGGGQILLYLSEGNIDLCGADGLRGEFLLGRYLLETKAVTSRQLETALKNCKPEHLLGEHMVTRMGVEYDAIGEALKRQASELIYEVVRWNKGRFSFAMGNTVSAAEKAQLGLPTGAIVMEGFRRVDEWRLIEGSFEFEDVLYPDPMAIERIAKKSKLNQLERQVLDAIDGELTIRELVETINASSFDVCKILYQFLNSRMVRREAAA